MKRSKTNIIEDIDTTQRVEYTTYGADNKPFVITGDYATIKPMYDAELASQPREKVQHTTSIAKRTVIEPMQLYIASVFSSRSMLRKARKYDRHNGTHFASALCDKWQLEKDLNMARELGLLVEDVCAKHRKALHDVATIR